MVQWTVPGYAHAHQLGASASGRTFLSTHAATGAPVVIKYLAEELVRDEVYLDRHRSETRRLAELDSPHVTALYEYVEAEEGVATVREYVAGASLRDLLAAGGALTPEAALTVLKGGLLGLTAGHAVGARHGDYRAEQVLVDVEGNTRVADFGAGSGRDVPGDARSTTADDTAAAVATFLECIDEAGAAIGAPSDVAAAAAVPKRLRAILPVLTDADDPAALASELDAAAVRSYGAGWEVRGRKCLARRVNRHVRRTVGRGRS